MTKEDIKLTIAAIISYCKTENGFQKRVYQRKVAAKTMTQLKANTNFLIIQELGELAADLKKRNITWSELRKLVQEQPNKNGEQASLFTSPEAKEEKPFQTKGW